MIYFKNDYSEGAHPSILDELIKSNLEQCDGYGEDIFSIQARELLMDTMDNQDVDIHFFSGGTQTNQAVFTAFLKPYEAGISADSGHVLTHETGAIENTGHKVIGVSSIDGKVRPEQIRQVKHQHTDEHMVLPKLVYISNPTELGTTYNKEELQALYNTCIELNCYLYIDGARLAMALSAEDNDLTLSDYTLLSHAFYIGATKCGGLIGEALVINCKDLQENFRFIMKQQGALLAKGRLIGLQFKTLFSNGLYYTLGSHANKMATLIRQAIKEAGYDFLVDTTTNQIFPILPYNLIKDLEKYFAFYIWQEIDDEKAAVRLVTSWATKEADVKLFCMQF